MALLQSLGEQFSASGHFKTAAVIAAASRLVREGRNAQATKLQHDAAESGNWSPAAQMILAACGDISHLQALVAPRAYQQLAVTNPYWKELSLLRCVLDNACPGTPTAVCDAMDDFAAHRWTMAQQWSKVAGNLKSKVMCTAFRGAGQGVKLLEIGTYCGYTALRLNAAFPSVRITTLEVDPIHVIVARNMVVLSGLTKSFDVWTGHSKYLLPRLAKHWKDDQQLRFGAVYMVRWGSQYHDDFINLDRLGLLSRVVQS